MAKLLGEAAKNKKIPVIEFQPEGYIPPSDPEFFEALKTKLVEAGFDTRDLIFSGFDARFVESPNPPAVIFGMNEAGWLNALKGRETNRNPAEYALKDNYNPAIGLYDKNLLQEVYAPWVDMDPEDPSDKISVHVKELGDRLADMPPDRIVDEVLVHVDYPDATPNDALVGLVKLKD